MFFPFDRNQHRVSFDPPGNKCIVAGGMIACHVSYFCCEQHEKRAITWSSCRGGFTNWMFSTCPWFQIAGPWTFLSFVLSLNSDRIGDDRLYFEWTSIYRHWLEAPNPELVTRRAADGEDQVGSCIPVTDEPIHSVNEVLLFFRQVDESPLDAANLCQQRITQWNIYKKLIHTQERSHVNSSNRAGSREIKSREKSLIPSVSR